jgi:hypothetical protein
VRKVPRKIFKTWIPCNTLGFATKKKYYNEIEQEQPKYKTMLYHRIQEGPVKP